MRPSISARHARLAALSFVGLLAATPAAAATLTAPGPVHPAATLSTMPLDIAASVAGEHVVLSSNLQGYRVLARRRADGTPITPAQSAIVNWGERIAVDRIGRVALVGYIPNQRGVYLRVYDRAGGVVGPTTRVDLDATGQLGGVAVGANGDGLIAVSWQQYDSVTNVSNAKVRVYAPTAVAVTPPLTIFNAPRAESFIRDLAVDQSGRVSMVSVRADSPSSSVTSIWFDRISSGGSPLLSSTRINDFTVPSTAPRIAVNPAGRGVITWVQRQPTETSYSILGQRLTEAGGRAGSNLVIDEEAGNSAASDVGIMDDGAFVVAWYRGLGGSAQPVILAREYNASGAPLGAPSALSTASSAPTAFFAAVSMDLAGGIVALWVKQDASNTFVPYWSGLSSSALPPITPLQPGVPVTGLSSASPARRLFKLTNGVGTDVVTFTMSGDGDADLIVRYAALPTATAFDAYPMFAGSGETIELSNAPAGDYYVEVLMFQPFTNVSLVAHTSSSGL